MPSTSEWSQSKKVAAFIAVVIAALALIAIVLALVFGAGKRDSAIEVEGIAEVLSLLPEEAARAGRVVLENRTATLAIYNGIDEADVATAEFKVREGTIERTEGDGGVVLTFIIETEVFSQEYQARFMFVGEGDDIQVRGMPAVQCLPGDSSQRRFKDFSCRLMSQETGAEVVPSNNILDHLPYSGPYYFIYGSGNEDGRVAITVDIDINTHSQRLTNIFLEYQKDSLEWMRERDSRVDEYVIRWRNLSRDVVLQHPDSH